MFPKWLSEEIGRPELFPLLPGLIDLDLEDWYRGGVPGGATERLRRNPLGDPWLRRGGLLVEPPSIPRCSSVDANCLATTGEVARTRSAKQPTFLGRRFTRLPEGGKEQPLRSLVVQFVACADKPTCDSPLNLFQVLSRQNINESIGRTSNR